MESFYCDIFEQRFLAVLPELSEDYTTWYYVSWLIQRQVNSSENVLSQRPPQDMVYIYTCTYCITPATGANWILVVNFPFNIVFNEQTLAGKLTAERRSSPFLYIYCNINVFVFLFLLTETENQDLFFLS